MVYNPQTARRVDPSPIGTESLHSNGHLMRKVATGYKGWKMVHRIVMEEELGRPLQPGEIVHHINHNKVDNRPENLEIMTRSEHSRYHDTLRPTPAGWNKLPDGQWSHSHDACIECGTTDVGHWGKGLCKNCYIKAYKKQHYQEAAHREKRNRSDRIRRKNTHLASGKWATTFDACIECGTTASRHVGKGLCNTCFCRLRYRKKHHLI